MNFSITNGSSRWATPFSTHYFACWSTPRHVLELFLHLPPYYFVGCFVARYSSIALIHRITSPTSKFDSVTWPFGSMVMPPPFLTWTREELHKSFNLGYHGWEEIVLNYQASIYIRSISGRKDNREKRFRESYIIATTKGSCLTGIFWSPIGHAPAGVWHSPQANFPYKLVLFLSCFLLHCCLHLSFSKPAFSHLLAFVRPFRSCFPSISLQSFPAQPHLFFFAPCPPYGGPSRFR